MVVDTERGARRKKRFTPSLVGKMLHADDVLSHRHRLK